MKIPELKELVAQGKQVYFSFYRDGELWYKTEILGSGGVWFEFPIPSADMQGATFMPEDKSVLFMRWIRKHLDFLRETWQNEHMVP